MFCKTFFDKKYSSCHFHSYKDYFFMHNHFSWEVQMRSFNELHLFTCPYQQRSCHLCFLVFMWKNMDGSHNILLVRQPKRPITHLYAHSLILLPYTYWKMFSHKSKFTHPVFSRYPENLMFICFVLFCLIKQTAFK